MKRQHTVRSFTGKCRRCGQAVFYWEGSAGSKVFFEYPVKGKLIKHVCRPLSKKRHKSFVKLSHSEHSIFDLERKSYICPVCGKLFKDELSLSSHIKDLEKTEQAHSDFFKNALDLVDFDEDYQKTIYDTINQENYLDNKYGVIFKIRKKRQN